jgi:hypothetical protein
MLATFTLRLVRERHKNGRGRGKFQILTQYSFFHNAHKILLLS